MLSNLLPVVGRQTQDGCVRGEDTSWSPTTRIVAPSSHVALKGKALPVARARAWFAAHACLLQHIQQYLVVHA